jgi:hypothetical protein
VLTSWNPARLRRRGDLAPHYGCCRTARKQNAYGGEGTDREGEGFQAMLKGTVLPTFAIIRSPRTMLWR